jgi:hypothetical protein
VLRWWAEEKGGKNDGNKKKRAIVLRFYRHHKITHVLLMAVLMRSHLNSLILPSSLGIF